MTGIFFGYINVDCVTWWQWRWDDLTGTDIGSGIEEDQSESYVSFIEPFWVMQLDFVYTNQSQEALFGLLVSHEALYQSQFSLGVDIASQWCRLRTSI